MSLNITVSEIKNLATNGKVFTRGKEYADAGHVQEQYYSTEHNILVSHVLSRTSALFYVVQIGIGARFRPVRVSCTCPASKQYQGCCKHMVAALLCAMHTNLSRLPEWQPGQIRAAASKQNLQRAVENPLSFASSSSQSEAESAEWKKHVAGCFASDKASSSLKETQQILESSLSADEQHRLSRALVESPELVKKIQAARTRSFSPLPASAFSLPSTASDSSSDSEDTFRSDSARESGQPAFHLYPLLSLKAILHLPQMTTELAVLSLSIRLEASGKSYKIKNYDQFISRLDRGDDIDFGRDLHYVPGQFRFTPAATKLLNWLLEQYQNAVERSSDTFLLTPTTVRSSGMALNPQRLWDFFLLFGAHIQDFDLRLTRGQNSTAWPCVLHDSFPLGLRFLWQSKNSLSHTLYQLSLTQTGLGQDALSVYSAQALKKKELDHSLRLLTRDGRLFCYQNEIYRLSGPDTATLAVVLQQLSLADDHRLWFDRQQGLAYLTAIYPYLGSKDKLQIAPELLTQVISAPLKSYVWLYCEGANLALQLAFFYGSYAINPHPYANLHWVLAEKGPLLADGQSALDRPELVTDEIQIIRQKEAEDQIRQLLIVCAFKMRAPGKQQNPSPNPAFYLAGERNIYRFLVEGLPQLKHLATDIFYDKSFRQMHVQPLAAFKGNVRLDQSESVLAIDVDQWPYSAADMQQILHAYREKRSYARLKNGHFIQLTSMGNAMEADDTAVESAELAFLDKLDRFGAQWKEESVWLPPFRAIPLALLLKEQQEERLATQMDASIPDVESGHELPEILLHLQEPRRLNFPVPASLDIILRSYQKDGFHWLCMLDYYGLSGILADDMGLGKTIQALAFISHIRKDRCLPALVAAPTSLIYNWQAEAARFLPELKTLLIEGSKTQRQEQIAHLDQYDLLICSYTILRQDIKELQGHMFSVFLLDEAQYIKNPVTQVARAVKKISAQRRLALTGTPIENNLSELWSIFDFLMPGYLFNHRRFQKELEIPIIKEKDAGALRVLNKLVQPFLLRRMKKTVLSELPDKIETLLKCDMTEAQAKLYYAHLASAQSEIKRLDDQERLERSQIEILALLTRMRQICCHPALFLSDYDGGSGKLAALLELLENLLDSGHRMLIFSQFTSMLSIIKTELDKRKLTYFYIDGHIPAKERIRSVERFNEGETALFLISLRAGGTGLNLTGADTVIHVDPWWNPAVEEQAADRAHRIGQKKVVQVFRLVTRGSIEEKICELQQRKLDLIQTVIQPGESMLSHMNLDELRNLFH